jgi:hypothetical protein
MGIMDALDNLHLVEGRPALGWQSIVAYTTHPDCEFFRQVECTATSATWETKRRQHPEPTRRTYTIEQARLAGLVRPRSPWERYPDDMCSKAAAVKLARVVYPDTRALGLYCPEELGGMVEEAAA